MTFDDLVFAASRWIHRQIAAGHTGLLRAMRRGALLRTLLGPTQRCLYVWATLFFEIAQAAHRRRIWNVQPERK